MKPINFSHVANAKAKTMNSNIFNQARFLLLGIIIPIIFFLAPQFAKASQDIDIIGGNNASNPKIAVVLFANDSNDNETNITNTIVNDLNITGEFTAIRYENSPLQTIPSAANSNKDIHNNSNDSTNNNPGASATLQYIVTGNVNGNTISFMLRKISNNNDNKTNNSSTTKVASDQTNKTASGVDSPAVMLNQNLLTDGSNMRKVAHIISNNIYQAITGTAGIFTTKIAYIARTADTYSITIADYDGHNQHTVLRSHQPISSLAWGDDGKQLAYVSYEYYKPIVYIQNLFGATRYKVAAFDGSNSSPGFAPQDKELAVTLSKDGGSHIYLVNNSRYTSFSKAIPLIDFGTIDTEADISSDGRVIFTSDHDGGPQIFMTNLQNQSPSFTKGTGNSLNDTATPVRLTQNLGRYNTSAKFAHDGKKITFINRQDGVLRTYLLDLNTNAAYPVSINTTLDIAPSFAPNDKLLLFSSDTNSMYLVNTTGTTQTRLGKINVDEIIDQQWANNY